MIIKIKRYVKPVNVTRKEKLVALKKKQKTASIRYDWMLNGESADEKIEDLHLFCTSIVEDLISGKFNTNENGNLVYSKLKKVFSRRELKRTKRNLDILFTIISKEKEIKEKVLGVAKKAKSGFDSHLSHLLFQIFFVYLYSN